MAVGSGVGAGAIVAGAETGAGAKFAAKGVTTGNAVGLAWTAAAGRIAGCGAAGWMWFGVGLGFVFARKKFSEVTNCCAAGVAGAPDRAVGTDAALVAGLGLRSRRPSDL